ncbi:PhoH family protein [bacterium]|nr:PhoH family protein [bacterium]
MSESVQKVITLDHDELLKFCGLGDRKLKSIQQRIKAKIVARGNELRINGPPSDVDSAYTMITDLLEVQRAGGKALTSQQIHMAGEHFAAGRPGAIKEIFLDTIPIPLKRKQVAPLSPNQKRYIDSIRQHDIVFAIGPAGTGKTFLAVAMAVASLINGSVGRIILVRPAVEAGERLGFLPGDIEQKLNPYLRPLYDALYEMLDPEKMKSYIEDGIIEIAPLAFMRGRTLNNSFIILDEAQNTTIEQMKMFLTRLGLDSQAVITGDITQTDLPKGQASGLVHVRKILSHIDGIDFIEFTGRDVVRHQLVQRIIQAYEKHG